MNDFALNGFEELNEQEMFIYDGGIPVGVIVVGAIFVGSALAVGIYVGYKEAEASCK